MQLRTVRDLSVFEFEEFCDYYDTWFLHLDQLHDGWFKRFKKTCREIWKLMDTDDTDYESYRAVCHPNTQCVWDVAVICYNSRETYFREGMMHEMQVAQGKPEELSYRRARGVFPTMYLRPQRF